MRYGHFSNNLISNLANYSISILIGLWFVPYQIRHLGVAAYGIIPLATTFVSYMSIITLVLNSAVGRYVTVAIEQGDYDEANRLFNTSFWGSIVLAFILLAPSALIIMKADYLFRIPQGYENQTRWLFVCTVSMFLLSFLTASFEISSYCRNRFDIRNAVNVSSMLLRVGIVVLFFNLFEPRMWHVGIGIVAAAILTFTSSICIWKKLTPQLNIQLSAITLDSLRKLTHTGGWIAVSQIGTLLLLSIDLLVVNRLFGPDAGGKYATIMQWSALLRGLGMSIAGVLGPTILYYYARNDIDGMVTYSRQAVKFLGLFIALPVGLISGLSRPILQVWLGPDFVSLAPLMTLMTLHLCINLGYLPLHNISTATNKVRLPGLFQVIIGMFNLGLALLLAGPVGWGMYGVAAAGAIVLTMRNIVFTPLYGAYILGRRHSIFLRELLPITSVAVILTGICWLFSIVIDLSSWTRLILFGTLMSATYSIIVWWLFINGEERRTILSMLPIMKSTA